MWDSGDKGGGKPFAARHGFVTAWSKGHLLIDVLALAVSVGAVIAAALGGSAWC